MAGAAAAGADGAVAMARRAARAAGAAAAPAAVGAVPARRVHTNSRYQAPIARPVARAARALRRRARAREAQPPAPRNVNISIRIFSPGDDGDVTQVADAAERAADTVLPLAREGGARFRAPLEVSALGHRAAGGTASGAGGAGPIP